MAYIYIYIYIYTLLEAAKKTNGLWRGVERPHRLFCYFLAHWGPGPWAHGPPQTRPQGPGPHSSELDGDRRPPHAAPELHWETHMNAPLRACSLASVLPCARAPLRGVLFCAAWLLCAACSFAGTQECTEGSHRNAMDKIDWVSPGRPIAESPFLNRPLKRAAKMHRCGVQHSGCIVVQSWDARTAYLIAFKHDRRRKG